MKVFKKNDEIELTIEDMSVDGDGIGRADGMLFFVRGALIGDRIRARVMKMKKSYGYARMIEMITPSADRVEPRCAFARPCGGCQIQTLSYEKQLEYKRKKVQDSLRRIGGLEEEVLRVDPVIGMEDPWCYRNKAQFPIGTGKNGEIITGFYAGRTHSIIENRGCAIGDPVNEQLLEIVISHMREHGIAPYDEARHQGLVRHVLIRRGYATGEIMVCLIINGENLPAANQLADRLFAVEGMTSFCVNINKRRGNTILGDTVRVIRGSEAITDCIGDVRFRISPKAFYQVNSLQTQKLYAKALEYAQLTGTETVWDLYCGIGTISLFLARKAGWVHGVEIVPEAVRDACVNARENGIRNVDFIAGEAERVLPEYCKKERAAGRSPRADVMVVDPPRKGCAPELLAAMLQMRPRRIVYVSCDAATLARDLRILKDGGYDIERISPVDMFPHTVHVETVTLLSRSIKKPDMYINMSWNMEDYRKCLDKE